MKKKILSVWSVCLFMALGAQAAIIQWDGGGATDNWNDFNNWSTTYVPGATVSDSAVMAGVGDSHTMVDAYTFANVSDLTVRDNATLTLSANLSGVNNFYLGPNNAVPGGIVNQTAGTLSAAALRVGSHITASTYSTYTISGGNINNSLILYVNRGTFTLEGSTASVTAGSMTVTSLGTLGFDLGASGVDAIDVTGTFTVDAASLLTIDGTGYTGGLGDITLVNAAAMSGSFGSGKYTVTGLGVENTGWKITQGTNGDLVLNVIPEPATIGMLGLGAIITLLLRRIRG